jgi:hypothetical protein
MRAKGKLEYDHRLNFVSPAELANRVTLRRRGCRA